MAERPSIEQELRELAALQEVGNLILVLQRRLDTLTCGELAEVLSGALGRRVAGMKVVELLGVTAPTRAIEPVLAADSSTPAIDAASLTRSAGFEAGAHEAAGRHPEQGIGDTPAVEFVVQPTRAPDGPAVRATMTGSAKAATITAAEMTLIGEYRWATEDEKQWARAILAWLRRQSGAVPVSELRKAIGIDGISARRALDLLLAVKLIERSGNRPVLRYASLAQEERQPHDSETTTGSKGSVAPPTIAGEPDPTEAAILDALRRAGDWTSSTIILAEVGGSIEALRLELRRLVQEGKVMQMGERRSRRYALAE